MGGRGRSGAGRPAVFPDDAYRAAGPPSAAIDDVLRGAAVVVRVNPPDPDAPARIADGAILLSFLDPAASADACGPRRQAGHRLSFDLLPRISRAQSMDALSSQATVAGYRAGLLAAEHLAKFFPMFMTAAGTVPPAKVLVMGVGVAGLQAIATARRLGAVVRAYDVRAAAKEEAESLGATFVDLGVSAEGDRRLRPAAHRRRAGRQQEALADEVAASDVVITTAAVPGRRAPILVTDGDGRGHGPGLGASSTWPPTTGATARRPVAGEEVVVDGTTVVGVANPPSSMPTHASLLYARNVQNLLALLGRGRARSTRIGTTRSWPAAASCATAGRARPWPSRGADGPGDRAAP